MYLSETVSDDNGQDTDVEYGETLVGDVDFERRMVGLLDGESLYSKLPKAIKPIVMKRLVGCALTGAERVRLHRWLAQRPTILCAPDYERVY